MKEAAEALQAKAFADKLQKRVTNQIETKIFQVGMLRACIREDKEWIKERGKKWSDVENTCRENVQNLKSSIKDHYPKMRLNLALSSPAAREDRILSDSATWLDSTPSHFISNFNDLPRLTREEKKEAEKLYVETLAKIPLEKFSSAEFKNRMHERKPLHLPLSGERYLTSNDKFRLREAVEDLQKEAKDSYFQITSEMPILGYIEREDPGTEELDKAFEKMESKLMDFAEEAKDSEIDMGLLLSFKPLVEELLKENKEYCLVAEGARIEVEGDESLKKWRMLGLGVVAAVSCLIAGPIGALACLTAGAGLGAVGYKEAQGEVEESLGRALTGKEFESMAELNEKEKTEFLAKLFFPLGLYGPAATTARAASGAVTRAVTGAKIIDAKSLSRFMNGNEQLHSRKSRFESGLQFANKNLQYVIRKSNGATVYHGSRSGSLLAFTSNKSLGGLRSSGELAQAGKSSFVGEQGAGISKRGINVSNLSTVKITDLDLAVKHSKKGEPFNYASSKESGELIERLKEQWGEDSFGLNQIRSLQQQRAQWKNLSESDRKLIEEDFPVLYGLKPGSERKISTHKLDIGGEQGAEIEVALKGGADFNEISVIFVPSDKVQTLKNMLEANDLSSHINVSPIEPIYKTFDKAFK